VSTMVLPTAADQPTGEARTGWDRPWVTAIICAALVVGGAFITFFRVPAAHHDVVWAEDAHIFLLQAVRQGPFEVLAQGYAGYQHLIPRLVAGGIVSTTPLEAYPVAVFIACSIMTGLVAAAVFLLARTVVPWLPARAALALITLLIPLSAQEVIGNLADFHTFCLWLGVWLIFATPRTWTASWLWAIVAFACIMTEVQMIALLAIIPFRARRRDRPAWPIFGGLLAGAVWQVLTIVTVPRDAAPLPLSQDTVVNGWLASAVLSLWEPDSKASRVILDDTGTLIPALVAGGIVVLGIAGITFGGYLQRLLLLGLIVGSFAVYAVSLIANSAFLEPFAEDPDTLLEYLLNIRYGVAPGMFLSAVVPVSIGILVARFDTLALRIVGGIALVAMIAVFVSADFRAESSRGGGPAWSKSVRAAVEQCESGIPLAQQPRLPVAPGRWLYLSCEEMEARAG